MDPILFDKYPKLMDPEYILGYDFDGSWTKTHPMEHYDELDVAVAIIRSEGNLTEAAKLLGRSRRSLANHIVRSSLLRELHEDVEASFLDLVEQKYKQAAIEGNDTAMRFFLTTKAKDRGYTTRVEQTGKDGAAIEVEATTVDWEKVDTETMRKLREQVIRSSGGQVH